MTRTRSLAATFLSLSAAAVLALVGAGSAHAAPSSSSDKAAPSVASAIVDSTGAADYWTSDRMRAAIPGDVLAGRALERGKSSSAASVLKGPKSKVAGTTGKPSLAQPANPVAHIGKVFFTLGGTNYVCSGNAVSAPNKSTVATAGHCLNEGPGAFATNFVFVPAYENGARPYGTWTAKALYTTAQWEASADISYDTGFAVMNRLGGEFLTDVVGGSGVAFNEARGLKYTAYGYPAAQPFNGERLWSCTGTATEDTNNPQFGTQGIPCDMTGGSSGGPWFIGTGPDGFQNSINSYGYNRSPVMYGPYWGEAIQKTYIRAARA
ncbi:serine-Type endopeptidase [Arthrobacter sp. Hiyo4]|nr:serine-Type endopeptidase [Arthrobacter sp. Hiyo4]